MNEKHLYCEPHGYIGTTEWKGTLEWLIINHLQHYEEPHNFYLQWENNGEKYSAPIGTGKNQQNQGK